MNIHEAENLARELMDEFGLTDWIFKFDGAKKRFGRCSYTKKTISMSLLLVLMNERPEVEETIRHEIGHALAGPGAGHGPKWVSAALSAGSNGIATYDSDMVATPNGKWAAYCPVHGRLTGRRHRRTKNRVCKHCQRPVEWRDYED